MNEEAVLHLSWAVLHLTLHFLLWKVTWLVPVEKHINYLMQDYIPQLLLLSPFRWTSFLSLPISNESVTSLCRFMSNCPMSPMGTWGERQCSAQDLVQHRDSWHPADLHWGSYTQRRLPTVLAHTPPS